MSVQSIIAAAGMFLAALFATGTVAQTEAAARWDIVTVAFVAPDAGRLENPERQPFVERVFHKCNSCLTRCDNERAFCLGTNRPCPLGKWCGGLRPPRECNRAAALCRAHCHASSCRRHPPPGSGI